MSTVPSSGRLMALDVFRGITMAGMLLVNNPGSWGAIYPPLEHAPWNGWTPTDLIFPFFLFIVGMSMPLSVEQRLKRNPSLVSLWLHVILRALSLLVLGLILANAEKADPARMPIGPAAWGLIGLIGAGLYLNVYPKSERAQRLAKILRPLGFIAVVVVFAIFGTLSLDEDPNTAPNCTPGGLELRVLLVCRRNAPFKGHWAIPTWTF